MHESRQPAILKCRLKRIYNGISHKYVIHKSTTAIRLPEILAVVPANIANINVPAQSIIFDIKSPAKQ